MSRLSTHPNSQAVIALGFACLLAVAGCGKHRPEMGQVAGRVTLDGTPVDRAVVMFLPQAGGRPAVGTTDADGEYRLTTLAADDGARIGHCAVTISKRETTGVTADPQGLSGPVGREGIRTQSFLPERFASPKDSGLTAEVKPGENRCNFEL